MGGGAERLGRRDEVQRNEGAEVESRERGLGEIGVQRDGVQI